ncbi:MAG: ribonuclease HII [Alphaproteobacteria bacterium]|nr:ribonuclease HII [Alphaproteobacteria bacterium]
MEMRHSGTVVGIDEVGRGPWAGPVVAACLFFHDYELPTDIALYLNDSKKMTALQREKIYDKLTNSQICSYAIGQASVEEIDEHNIRQATFMAMERSFNLLNQKIDVALIDGNCAPKLPCQTIPIIKGDAISLSIAAASVIAKVYRDKFMQELSLSFPGYGWEKNAGYGTKKHQEGISLYGITPHHRKSFAPIRNALKAA